MPTVSVQKVQTQSNPVHPRHPNPAPKISGLYFFSDQATFLRFLQVLADGGPRKGWGRAVWRVFEQMEKKRAFSCFFEHFSELATALRGHVSGTSRKSFGVVLGCAEGHEKLFLVPFCIFGTQAKAGRKIFRPSAPSSTTPKLGRT